jgi:glycosyltransferase involved in cell wall biosynthesis
MLKAAILFHYPLNELAEELGFNCGFYPGCKPMMNLVNGLLESEQVQVDVITTTKLISDTRVVRAGPRLNVHIIGVPHFSGMVAGFIPRTRLIHRYLEQMKPDIVHGQGTEREWGISAVTSSFPHVLTVHGILRAVHKINKPFWLSYQHVGRWVEQRAFDKARHVIAISPYVNRALASLKNAHFHAVPNAVAPVFFEIKKNVPSGKVVYSALIDVHKGFGDLLRSARCLEQQGVAARFVIVGKSSVGGKPYYMRCLKWAANNLDLDRFQILGWSTQDQYAEVLKDASCLAHPSYCENFAMVIAEAMASGTPVVAYSVGGIPDYIEDGVNGFLVPPGNIELLAQRIAALVSDPELSLRMGAKARETAQTFRIDLVAKRTLAVYNAILG